MAPLQSLTSQESWMVLNHLIQNADVQALESVDIIKIAKQAPHDELLSWANHIAKADPGTSFPQSLIRFLATAHEDIAKPVLIRSSLVTPSIQLEVIRNQSLNHRVALAQRLTLAPTIISELSKRNELPVLEALCCNPKITCDSQTIERMISTFWNCRDMQSALVQRQELDATQLTRLYLRMPPRFKKCILDRAEAISPSSFDMIRYSNRQGLLCDPHLQTHCESTDSYQLLTLKIRNDLVNDILLKELLEAGQYGEFRIALAYLLGIQIEMIETLFSIDEGKGAILVCRTAGIDKSVFDHVCTEKMLPELNQQQRATCIELYERIPRDAARHILRFWFTQEEQSVRETSHISEQSDRNCSSQPLKGAA